MIHSFFQDDGMIDPISDEELEQELLFLEFSRGESKTDVLSSVVDFNYQNSRIEFITDQLPTTQINELIQYLEDVFSQWSSGDYVITGSQFLSYILGKYVLQSQFITILITFSFIWILFVGLFGFRLGTIGMIPNFVPMLITIITSLDFGNLILQRFLFLVLLGLCVDDTIHWLHYYQQSLNDGHDAPELMTNQMMVKPLLITSIVLGIGLGFWDLLIWLFCKNLACLHLLRYF